jgi:enoyl-CoA hydratase/carnithine racemase
MHKICLHGPGKNALGSDMIGSILREMESANGAPLLFTGEGDAFSAGLNLKEVGSLDHDGMESFLHRLEHFFKTVWLYPGPTAAAINGHAIAGGCILAMCCDTVVATSNERARIGLNEVALGLRFPPGLQHFVRATVASDNINEVILGSGLHSPTEALRLGLVKEVADDPVDRATERLSKLAKHPSDAYAATKRDLRHGVMDASEEDQQRFVNDVLPFWTSPELKAKIRSILGG